MHPAKTHLQLNCPGRKFLSKQSIQGGPDNQTTDVLTGRFLMGLQRLEISTVVGMRRQ